MNNKYVELTKALKKAKEGAQAFTETPRTMEHAILTAWAIDYRKCT